MSDECGAWQGCPARQRTHQRISDDPELQLIAACRLWSTESWNLSRKFPRPSHKLEGSEDNTYLGS
jgi:hypothetical protein